MTTQPDVHTLTFEQAMQELEIMVKKLESGDFTLDQALKSYERGIALKNRCENALQEARLRVTQIHSQKNGEPAKESDVTASYQAAS